VNFEVISKDDRGYGWTWLSRLRLSVQFDELGLGSAAAVQARLTSGHHFACEAAKTTRSARDYSGQFEVSREPLVVEYRPNGGKS